MTHYERIKNMSIEELSDFLNDIYQHNIVGFLTVTDTREYLESEDTE